MTPDSKQVKVILVSFGFKYGPPNANHYFDVGFIKNPARQDKWGFFSKPTAEMRKFILSQEEAKTFLEKIEPLLIFLSTIDQNQVFAFGCSAGRHRSPLIVEELSHRLQRAGIRTKVFHRDNNV